MLERLATRLLPAGAPKRRTFWIFAVVQGALAAAFIAIGVFVIDQADDDPSTAVVVLETAIGIAYLACAATTATIGVNRIRARRGSAWWALLALIPYFGPLWYVREAGLARDTRAVPRRTSAARPVATEDADVV